MTAENDYLTETKRLLGADEARLVFYEHLRDACSALADDVRRLENNLENFGADSLGRHLGLVEAATRPLAVSLAWTASWGRHAHDPTLRSVADQVAHLSPLDQGPSALVPLRRWPATITTYAVGVAATYWRREELIAPLLTAAIVPMNPPRPALYALEPVDVVGRLSNAFWPERSQELTPHNNHLHDTLRDWLCPDLTPVDDLFTRAFDRFEFLWGLLYWDARSQTGSSGWAPQGAFWWRRRFGWLVPEEVEAEIARGDSPLLLGGAFNGDRSRAQSALESYMESLRSSNRFV